MALRLQKFSPVDREYPIYEVVDEEGAVLFDISRTDQGSYEMALHEEGAGRVLPLQEALPLIERARALLEQEDG